MRGRRSEHAVIAIDRSTVGDIEAEPAQATPRLLRCLIVFRVVARSRFVLRCAPDAKRVGVG